MLFEKKWKINNYSKITIFDDGLINLRNTIYTQLFIYTIYVACSSRFLNKVLM